jgi:hypothetical protein
MQTQLRGISNSVSEKPMTTPIVSSSCKASGCTQSSVVGIGGQDLCLDHFFSACYQRLDKLEKVVCRGSLTPAELRAAFSFLDECADRTLFISFRSESLSNLERSRLLEILLSCGDLQQLLRRPSTHSFSFVASLP